jgi:hypothetical protein
MMQTPANELIQGSFVDIEQDESAQRAIVDATRACCRVAHAGCMSPGRPVGGAPGVGRSLRRRGE